MMRGRPRARRLVFLSGALLRSVRTFTAYRPLLVPPRRTWSAALASARSASGSVEVSRPRSLPASIERELELQHLAPETLVVGVDEAGRGAWAGPVVAAAVMVRPGAQGLEAGITDSKRLNERQREWVFEQLRHHPDVHWGIGEVSERRIDEINILQATYEAMSSAFWNMRGSCTKKGLRVFVDGNRVPPQLSADYMCTSVVKGDSKVFEVAAASIIAKVYRDRLMRDLSTAHSDFTFDCHKGYGTRGHLSELQLHGHQEVHRRSFNPIKTFLRTGAWRGSQSSEAHRRQEESIA